MALSKERLENERIALLANGERTEEWTTIHGASWTLDEQIIAARELQSLRAFTGRLVEALEGAAEALAGKEEVNDSVEAQDQVDSRQRGSSMPDLSPTHLCWQRTSMRTGRRNHFVAQVQIEPHRQRGIREGIDGDSIGAISAMHRMVFIL